MNILGNNMLWDQLGKTSICVECHIESKKEYVDCILYVGDGLLVRDPMISERLGGQACFVSQLTDP